MNYVYGPVPSRRLGISLGIDIVPPSTCTFSCIYCQLGKTLHKVNHWPGIEFPNADEVTSDLTFQLKKYDQIDFITISGSGEPTLNPHLGEITERIRSLTPLPLVLITNSSLLTYDTVLSNAKKFDVVMPSLDAGDNKTFKLINRPAKGFDINEITDAIKRLRQDSKSEIWLEVMLVKGKITNAASEPLKNIMKKINDIMPSMVFLNSPIRPPCESYAKPLDDDEMNKIMHRMKAEIPKNVEIEVVPKLTSSNSQILNKNDIVDEILQMLEVRPCTLQDISNTSGVNPNEVSKYIGILLDENRISKKVSSSDTYYLRYPEMVQ